MTPATIAPTTPQDRLARAKRLYELAKRMERRCQNGIGLHLIAEDAREVALLALDMMAEAQAEGTK